MNRPVFRNSPVAIDGSDIDQPLFVRVAQAVVRDIRRGRLAPGDRLPSSRVLADQLSIHRNTVLAAYRELQLEGWIETRHARGTYVCGTLPEVRGRFSPRLVRGRRRPDVVGFEVPRAPMRQGFPLHGAGSSRSLLMFGGGPDLRLVPTTALARAYRRAVRNPRDAVLGYGDPQGHPRLRSALAAMLTSTRGFPVDVSEIVVTRGSQMAVDLLARVLLSPSDRVAVEAWGYRPAWEALQSRGSTLVPIPVDAEGLQVERLEQAASQRAIRAVYVTPHHQYPTTGTLSATRRLALLDLAKRHRMIVIEDDYDHEFHYEGRPVLPLASADDHGVVVYVGTLSKILAPGLRVGYLVAPKAVVERATEERLYVDRQGDLAVEAAVAELLEDGEIQRHAHRMRRVYRPRRDLLVERLDEHLRDVLTFRVPPGGMALWAKVRSGIDVDAWADRTRENGVVVYPGRVFAFDRRRHPFLRLGFAALDEHELTTAVQRLVAAM